LCLAGRITDGFALVRVGRVKGVPVLVWNQRSGRTDGGGEFVVPDLNSFAVNRIALDRQSIPMNWSLERSERTFRLPYRGGGVVDFAPTKVQSFEGRAFLVRGGVPEPAEYAGFEIDIHGTVVQSVVGKGGLFYFETLPEGSYPARLFLDQKECRFPLRIPRSDRIPVDLGEIRCEMGK